MKTLSPNRTLDYDMLVRQADALLAGETDFIANAANFSAFMLSEIDGINWSGFYFASDDGLVLGPFAGKPACSRLPVGRGVCGAAVREKQTLVVDDVHAFSDHIACDANSRSEIVVPLICDSIVAGVFDIDSPELGRFSEHDREGIERLVATFLARTAFPARMRRGRTTLSDELARAICEYRLEHADILGMFENVDAATASPDAAYTFLERVRPLLLAHMRHEEGWLFPRLMQGGDMLKKRVEHIARESQDAALQAQEFFEHWTTSEIIASNSIRFDAELRSMERAIRGRIVAEEQDLFASALAEFNQAQK